jgi:hypothetical protein
MQDLKFKSKMVLFEFMMRYLIYIIALSFMFKAIFDSTLWTHTILFCIWFVILIVLAYLIHIEIFYVYGKSICDSEKISFNIFKMSK